MLPDYWLPRPPLAAGSHVRSTADEVLARLERDGSQRPLDLGPIVRSARADLWQVLCRVAERRTFAFHGTADPAIESFVPRRPVDFAPFGDQKAVFATSDPIWAMFYAIVARARGRITLNNGCIVVAGADGRPGVPHYYFSISRDVLPERPWRAGHLYLLPAETFVEQPAGTYAGLAARVPQLASPVPVRPLARIEVEPHDFPFLAQIRGHDDERLAEYAQAVMAAAPWPGE